MRFNSFKYLIRAYGLGKSSREINRLVWEEVPKFSDVGARMKYQIFLVEHFLRNEEKAKSFSFLGRMVYNTAYSGSILGIS